ncbi:hypothetical protein OR571_05560 [Psychrobacillus sp. NEAU-3TGS]|uniref:hypothetical protein n=1 Tax=Psychrobacillus sp. NEAU-3TGS TaxID=2995412 RepID=UPI00249903C0|nr:hypothetical protein [Psychrobacillus sp. NEAU-3TGS]MDI2586613.1 hypothetical protein [Psychrobacillus sp. NEAU-3TGS]
MNVTEKINTFIAEYNNKLNQLNERIESSSKRVTEIEMEIKYISQKELPEASVQRVLSSESGLENKLKKTLIKLQTELEEKNEEVLILQNALQQYHFQAANELKQYQQLFKDERAIAMDKIYSKMMSKKREYVEAMKEEAEVLHQFQAVDLQIQLVEQAAGMKKDVYNIFTVDSAPMPSHLKRYNGIYLALTHEEVQKIIKKTPIDLGYLDKFKHTKNL